MRLGAQEAPLLLEGRRASRSAGHWWTDLTSGSSSVPDTASFCQVESSGEFRPAQRPLSTWELGGCSQQCRSRRVPGQGLRGATGIREPDMSVCQRISEDKRRTSDRIPASVDPQQLPGAAPSGRSRFPGAAATSGGQCGRRVPPKAVDLSQRQRPPTEQPLSAAPSLLPPSEPILPPPGLGQQITRGFPLLPLSMPFPPKSL